MQITDKPLM